MYEYTAIVTDVYDGDTITVDVDLGLEVWKHGQRLRLVGIDAPEVRGENKEAGFASRDALSAMLLNQQVLIKTFQDKKEKFGRWLALVYVNGVEVNQWLVNRGHARVYMPVDSEGKLL